MIKWIKKVFSTKASPEVSQQTRPSKVSGDASGQLSVTAKNSNAHSATLDEGPSKALIKMFRDKLINTTPQNTEIVEAAKLMLGLGVNVNVKDFDGCTVLNTAVIMGNIALVKLLLENHADVNVKDDNGTTALTSSALKGNTEMVRLLLDNRADVNISNNGITALMFAANQGHIEVVKLLLSYYSDIQDKDKAVSLALVTARAKGLEEMVKVLQEAKA